MPRAIVGAVLSQAGARGTTPRVSGTGQEIWSRLPSCLTPPCRSSRSGVACCGRPRLPDGCCGLRGVGRLVMLILGAFSLKAEIGVPRARGWGCRLTLAPPPPPPALRAVPPASTPTTCPLEPCTGRTRHSLARPPPEYLAAVQVLVTAAAAATPTNSRLGMWASHPHLSPNPLPNARWPLPLSDLPHGDASGRPARQTPERLSHAPGCSPGGYGRKTVNKLKQGGTVCKRPLLRHRPAGQDPRRHTHDLLRPDPGIPGGRPPPVLAGILEHAVVAWYYQPSSHAVCWTGPKYVCTLYVCKYVYMYVCRLTAMCSP